MKKKAKNTYEIYGYNSQEDFDNCKYYVLDQGIKTKAEAMRSAKRLLKKSEPGSILKVQSTDREFIEILKKKSKLKEYEVLVRRISYASRNIVVKATSEKEAKRLAIDEAGNFEFSEHDADYEVDSISTKSFL